MGSIQQLPSDRLYTHCPVCQWYWDAVVWEGPAAHLQAGRPIDWVVPAFTCCCQSFRPGYFKITRMDRLIAVGPLGMLKALWSSM